MTLKKCLNFAAVLIAAGLLTTQMKTVQAVSKKETVTFATVGTTAPFSYEKHGQLTGYDVEVARAIFKGNKQYKVKFQKTEWSSVFTGLDSGKFQLGGNNISFTKERSAKYLYSYPIGSTPSVLVVPKTSNIKTYKDIAGHSTQVVQGTTTAAQLKAFNKTAHKAVELKYTNENITQILTNLNEGKTDFKIFDAPTVNAIIKNQGLNHLKAIDLKAKQQPYIYFIFGQDQSNLQKFVNKRIKALLKDGTLSKLAKTHLGGHYVPAEQDLLVPTKK